MSKRSLRDTPGFLSTGRSSESSPTFHVAHSLFNSLPNIFRLVSYYITLRFQYIYRVPLSSRASRRASNLYFFFQLIAQLSAENSYSLLNFHDRYANPFTPELIFVPCNARFGKFVLKNLIHSGLFRSLRKTINCRTLHDIVMVCCTRISNVSFASSITVIQQSYF